MKASVVHCLVGIFGLVGLAACTMAPDAETKPMGQNVLSKEAIRAAKSGPVSFTAHVKPVLEDKCVMCHNRKALPGRMSLENRQEAKRTGALGSFIISGHPEHSLLMAKASGSYSTLSAMPVVGMRLTPEETEILTKWIKEGASWPTGAAGTLRIAR